MRTSVLFCWLVFLAGVLLSYHYYPLLPESVPSHFGSEGKADGWMEKDAFLTFMGILGVSILGLFLVLARLLRHIPNSLINLPHRDYWLAPERRTETLERIGDMLAWFGVATLCFFLAILKMSFDAALMEDPRLDEGIMTALLVGYLGYTALWVVRLYARFRKPAPGLEGSA